LCKYLLQSVCHDAKKLLSRVVEHGYLFDLSNASAKFCCVFVITNNTGLPHEKEKLFRDCDKIFQKSI